MMKKVIAINGSPRRNGNTSKILQAETKTLYAYNTTQFSDYAKYESSIVFTGLLHVIFTCSGLFFVHFLLST